MSFLIIGENKFALLISLSNAEITGFLQSQRVLAAYVYHNKYAKNGPFPDCCNERNLLCGEMMEIISKLSHAQNEMSSNTGQLVYVELRNLDLEFQF